MAWHVVEVLFCRLCLKWHACTWYFGICSGRVLRAVDRRRYEVLISRSDDVSKTSVISDTSDGMWISCRLSIHPGSGRREIGSGAIGRWQ